MERTRHHVDGEEWARRKQLEHWRASSPAEKLRLLGRLHDGVMALHLAGLRARHPEDTDEQLRLRSACQRYGRQWVEQLMDARLHFLDD